VEVIGQQAIWSFDDYATSARVTTCGEVRKGKAHRVRTYLELAKKVAELQFKNRDFVLLFRGQDGDYRNRQKNTSLKPSLLREDETGNLPSEPTLRSRFELLQLAEEQLVRLYEKRRFPEAKRIRRQRILRWSILQHYEVCRTPLLDVTHSLRIAASFASDHSGNAAYVFVIGVPNLSGAITASAEAGLQVVRLSSVCPPSAVRPHIQEGYLLGEYPEMGGTDQKGHYKHYEIDFGRRLIAKFRFSPKTFWRGDTFPKVGRRALYPSPKDDPLHELALDVKMFL
jgi:hypothetical protein